MTVNTNQKRIPNFVHSVNNIFINLEIIGNYFRNYIYIYIIINSYIDIRIKYIIIKCLKLVPVA